MGRVLGELGLRVVHLGDRHRSFFGEGEVAGVSRASRGSGAGTGGSSSSKEEEGLVSGSCEVRVPIFALLHVQTRQEEKGPPLLLLGVRRVSRLRLDGWEG